ncbi:MAG: hypothetical protein ACKVH8_08970 [Pirellulales bacterium]
MSSDTDNVIPELQDWNDGRGIDMDGYLSCMGNYELAIVYAKFYWPNFVEHDGCIFRGALNIEIYEQWKGETKGNKTAIESVMNHVHILDMFPNVEQPPTRQQIVFIGRQLKEMWTAKLHSDFPNKDVVVDFFDDCGDDLLEYQITYFQR